jgi:hypothetical protein
MWKERSLTARTRGLRFVEPKEIPAAPPGSFFWAVQEYIRTGQVVKTWHLPVVRPEYPLMKGE